MKKLLFILLMALLPQLSFCLFADGSGDRVDIPILLHKSTDVKHERSFAPPIGALYKGGDNIIMISLNSDMGEVVVVVTNYTTGNTYSSWSDSSVMSDAFVQIDGMAGIYELVLTSEYGDVFIGNFILE